MDSPAPSPEHGGPAFGDRWALFLDIDGTLVEIAQRPEAVVVEPRLARILTALVQVTEGATAVISGRAIADIDRLLAPLKLPAAGQHGAERRDIDGRIFHDSAHREALARVRARISDFAARHAGLILEDKGASLSLHYREAPHMRGAAERALEDALTSLGGAFTLHRGKQVLELRPARCDKGGAIAAFMDEAPFAGRCPVFIGDDVTDEDGFRTVNRLGGHTLKVGAGTTAARWRLRDAAEVLDWLQRYTVYAS